jgi:CRISPR-associated protein Csm1
LDEVFGINLDEYDYSDFSSPVNDPEFKNLNSYEKMIASLHNLYTDIGEVLPKTRFMLEVVSDSFTGGKHTPFIVNFRGFHTNWIFLKDEKELEQFLNDIEKSSLESLKIYSINNTGITTYLSDVNNLGMNVINRCPFPVSLGFRFIGKSTPMQNGSIMEFGEIARLNAEEGKELDYELLGILRMDVDNLGSIFSFGLKRNEDKDSIESLSRIVNLSRDLNLFFLGYLNKIAEGKRIYITYSGGDDLFVVGSWINIISFALEVKEKFTRFACLNDNVTISGGVYLSKPSFPIGKSARFAGEKESLAKSKSSEKDRISVFDRVLKWDELKELLDYAKQLDALVKTDNKKEEIKSSYLHFLLTQTTETLNEDGTINYDKYFSKLPKIKYSLARRDVHAQGIKGKDGKIKENVRLLSKIINDDPHKYYENFIVPASYVILKNRKSQ